MRICWLLPTVRDPVIGSNPLPEWARSEHSLDGPGQLSTAGRQPRGPGPGDGKPSSPPAVTELRAHARVSPARARGIKATHYGTESGPENTIVINLRRQSRSSTLPVRAAATGNPAPGTWRALGGTVSQCHTGDPQSTAVGGGGNQRTSKW